MQLSSPLFFVISSVMGTVLIAAEPCANSGGVDGGYVSSYTGGSYPTDGYGVYDMTACNACAENGNGQTGHSVCCNALYRHSLGRDDDDDLGNAKSLVQCIDLNGDCTVGARSINESTGSINGGGFSVGIGACYPGLTCGPAQTCQLPADNPNAHAAATALVTSSSSMGTNTKGGPSFVLVMVGLLGATMVALKVVLQRRHRGLLRRHQYSAVDATPIAV